MTNTLQQVRELIEKKIEIRRENSKTPELFETCMSHIGIYQDLLSDLNSLPGEWIAVTDGLPENSNDILMRGTFGFVKTAIGRYHHTGENGFVIPSTVGFYKTETVTHWMPLPPNQ